MGEADSEGQVHDPYRTWSFFDELGRRTAVVDEVGHAVQRLHDSLGNLVLESDVNAQGGGSKALVELDPFGERDDLSVSPIVNCGRPRPGAFSSATARAEGRLST